MATLKSMKEGDWMIYYSPTHTFGGKDPCRCFTAIGIVQAGEPYLFEMSNDFIPWRRDISFLNAKDALIVPLLDELTFIRDKKKWGFPFRRGSFEIQKADFELIAKAMGVHTQVDSKVGNFSKASASEMHPAKQALSEGNRADAAGCNYGDAGEGEKSTFESSCVEMDFKKISVHETPKKSPGFLLWHVSTAWRSRIEAELKTLGLTHPQFVILATTGWLTRNGEPVTQVAIGKMAGLDPNTNSQILKGLEKKGLIHRGQSTDGRAKNVTLTPKGSKLLNRALPAVENEDNSFFNPLSTEELNLMVQVYQRLVERKNLP
jgi:DNA-binding MarR family transcriptional regulator